MKALGNLGWIRVELTSADLEGAYKQLLSQGLELRELAQKDGLTTLFTIPAKSYGSLKRIASGRGDRLTLLEKRGAYWKVRGFLARPILISGWAIVLVLSLLLPSRVLLVQVDGYTGLEERKLLDAAEEAGLGFWADRSGIDSEKIKNALISRVPELRWVGVNTWGSRAVISVRMGEETSPAEQQGPAGIYADRAGLVTQCVVTRGTGLCAPGQAVEEGQLLISGYTACEGTLLLTRAEGEVFAQTRRNFSAVSPAECLYRGDRESVSRSYSILLGKKRINLWKDSGICPGTCGRMYAEYRLTLPGGFSLPIALGVEEMSCCQVTRAADYLQEDLLRQAILDQLSIQMFAGTILASQEVPSERDDIFLLEGFYLCQEQIGRPRQEQIGEYNGKSD